MPHWIDATGGTQQIVADGPHRIEQTASGPIQQSIVLVGANPGQTVVLGARPSAGRPADDVAKFQSRLI